MSDKKDKGIPKGRRPTLYVCAAIVDGKLVQKEMVVEDQNPDPDAKNGIFPQEIAIANFESEFGVKPEAVSIPVFENKGINKKSTVTKKRLTFDRNNIDEYRLDDELKRHVTGIGMDWLICA